MVVFEGEGRHVARVQFDTIRYAFGRLRVQLVGALYFSARINGERWIFARGYHVPRRSAAPHGPILIRGRCGVRVGRCSFFAAAGIEYEQECGFGRQSTRAPAAEWLRDLMTRERNARALDTNGQGKSRKGGGKARQGARSVVTGKVCL